MECEMCGAKVGTRRYLVDGTTMRLGLCCARFGTPVDTPAQPDSKPSIQHGLQRRQARMATRDVFAQQETVDLVEDYGGVVRRAREKQGWSHAQLGDKVSARVPELRQIEANHLRPSDRLALALEKALGIRLHEKVDAAAKPTTPKGGTGGLTIGDLLRDAKKKA